MMFCQNENEMITGPGGCVLTGQDELWAQGCMIWLQLQHLWCRTHETGRPPGDETKVWQNFTTPELDNSDWVTLRYIWQNYRSPLSVLRWQQSMELQCSFKGWRLTEIRKENDKLNSCLVNDTEDKVWHTLGILQWSQYVHLVPCAFWMSVEGLCSSPVRGCHRPYLCVMSTPNCSSGQTLRG